MKKTNIVIYLITILIVSSCFKDLVPNPKSTTSTTDTSNDAPPTTQDFVPSFPIDDAPPLHVLNIMMAGQVNWLPGSNYTYFVDGSDPVIDLQLAQVLFATDSRLKLRFKVMPQPNTIGMNDEFCYGRNSGVADQFQYKKLKFNVRLRNIVKTTFFIFGISSFTNTTVSSHYHTRTIGPLDVGSLSEVIDLSLNRDDTSLGTVVEIANVRADSECQYHTANNDSARMAGACPAETLVREQSCWHLEMQVSTNETRDM